MAESVMNHLASDQEVQSRLSDPDLVTCSGKMILVTKSGWPLNRGQILCTYQIQYREKIILSLNRGVTKLGATKSGSDSNFFTNVSVMVPYNTDKCGTCIFSLWPKTDQRPCISWGRCRN
eukprot:sb/3476173/